MPDESATGVNFIGQFDASQRQLSRLLAVLAPNSLAFLVKQSLPVFWSQAVCSTGSPFASSAMLTRAAGNGTFDSLPFELTAFVAPVAAGN